MERARVRRIPVVDGSDRLVGIIALADIVRGLGKREPATVEEVLAGHPDVAECAVVGVADALKGEVPVGFVVTKAGVDRSDAELAKQLVERVRERIGPVAAFRLAMVVKRLPKTRSGKILRGTMKKIADGAEYSMPATIDDPAILDEIAESLKKAGYPGKA
jgi:propionyl-CoA synthetase